MMMRGFVATTATALCLLVGLARADPKGEIAAKSKQAMESYDLMDYDAAKKLLNQALATAKKNKLDKDPVTAHIYIDLGLAAFANSDPDTAKVAFQSAVQIDPKIKIDAAYKSPELDKLLEEARSETGGGGGAPDKGGGTPVDSGVDCTKVKGFQHDILDSGKRGTPQPIEALVGADLKASKVSAFYRAEGATEFTEVKLTAQGACKYVGNIPASAMKGSLVHYYVAAYAGDGGKPIAAKGAAGSPNIIELTGSATVATRGDTEDPLSGGVTAKAETPSDGVSSGVVVESKPAKVYIAIMAGAAAGYVTGDTEGGNAVKNCCIGLGGVIIEPELGFFINPRTSIGVAGRIGLPLGANVDGHATLAPGGLLRLRYALADGGEGVRVMGQIGAGIVRNTIKLDNPAMQGMDTDIVAQGPLLLGGGVGYTKKLSGSVAFVLDFSLLAGIAVTSKLGTSVLNSGVTGDFNLGFAIGI